MCDTKKFIMEIEGNPSFWDITSSDYQNRDKKKYDWEDTHSLVELSPS
jgi:hypothetical protein